MQRRTTVSKMAEGIALAKAPVPVLGEGGVIGHLAFQAQPAEPAIRQVQVHLLAQPPLGADAEAVADSSMRIISSGSIEGRPVVL